MTYPIKTPEMGPFWEKKVLSFNRKMNQAGDGKIKKSDYEALADRYVEIGKLDGVREKQVRRKIMKLWEDFFSKNAPNDEISEETFVQEIKNHKDLLADNGLLHLGLLFDLIDLNGDGVIQKGEYALFLKVFRVEDPKEVDEAFNIVDTNGNGLMSYDEFIYAGLEYWMTNDESLPTSHMFGAII